MIIKKTAYLSLLVQFITGLIDVWGLTIPVDQSNKIFKQLLLLELIVQIIEFIFYVWFVANLNKLSNATVYRYFDWFISTPLMLITFMAYLDDKNYDNIWDFISKNLTTVITVLILNSIMLLFGLLHELKIIKNKYLSTIMGFIPFVLYYIIIWFKFRTNNPTKEKVFWYFVTIWGLYGLAALQSYEIKNSMYNILDLFSKNFFGLFLVWIIINKK
jgi:bacteriorhodopsin